MGKTDIAWTDYSSNPIKARNKATGKRGWMCIKHSPQCEHCYAEGINKHWGNGLPYESESLDKVNFELVEGELKKLANMKSGKVFVEDMSDLFGPFVQPEWRERIFDVLEQNTRITPQILTKWPNVMEKYLSRRWGDNPPGHIWIGATYVDERSTKHLMSTPAAIRYLSVEPMLDRVDIARSNGVGSLMVPDGFSWFSTREIKWVVIGCESGPRRRHTNIDDVRDLVAQCKAANVAVFVKQVEINGKVSRNPAEWPQDIAVQEFPR